MGYIYNITDSSDGTLLLTIETTKKCKTALASIKKNTDRIWYKNEEGELPLSVSDQQVVDDTINGDWVEIFHNLMGLMGIEYQQSEVETV